MPDVLQAVDALLLADAGDLLILSPLGRDDDSQVFAHVLKPGDDLVQVVPQVGWVVVDYLLNHLLTDLPEALALPAQHLNASTNQRYEDSTPGRDQFRCDHVHSDPLPVLTDASTHDAPLPTQTTASRQLAPSPTRTPDRVVTEADGDQEPAPWALIARTRT